MLERFTGALRGSGRFIWPAYHLITIGFLAIVVRRLSARDSLALISFCPVIQVADSWEALRGVRNSYESKFDNTSANHPTLLTSAFWQRAAEKYKRIECILPIDQAEPNNQPENYFPLCYFAATQHIPINTAYLARVDRDKFKTVRTNLLQLIVHGHLYSAT